MITGKQNSVFGVAGVLTNDKVIFEGNKKGGF
jgi:hypothetical protein